MLGKFIAIGMLYQNKFASDRTGEFWRGGGEGRWSTMDLEEHNGMRSGRKTTHSVIFFLLLIKDSANARIIILT